MNPGKLITFIFISSILICVSAGAGPLGPGPGPNSIILDNGATIACEYIPGSPLVVIQIRVLSGLSNEGNYAGSGVSHFLEHLLFKRTHDRNPDQVNRAIREMGGIVNGATGLDSAEYHITVPNERFEEAFNLLTDMVMDAEFTDEEMEKERDVILKEMNLYDDDPRMRIMNELFSRAYLEHVYSYPIIGYRDRFQALTRDDITGYHRETYTPDRIVIGIAGGVPPEEALETAKKKIGGYERGKPWIASSSVEGKQMDQKSSGLSMDTGLGYLMIGFHTVSMYSDDLYPVDVLSVALGGGRGSRLYGRLVVEKELLYSVSASSLTPRYPGLFMISGVGEPGKLEEARKEIFVVIEELKAKGVRQEEVERTSSMVSSSHLRMSETTEGVVSNITESQIYTGTPSFFEKYVEEIGRVKAKDVQAAASKYLRKENSTVITIVPEGFSGEETTSDILCAMPEEDHYFTLSNGMRVIIKKRPRLPLVSCAIAFQGGLRAENTADNGISNLTASLLVKGTKKRGERDIVPVFEEMGGSIRGFSGYNSLGAGMSALAANFDRSLDILADVILEPAFPEEEIRKEKEKVIASIRRDKKEVLSEGLYELGKVLYGGHPYSMRREGEIVTVENIKRGDIAAFHGKYFTPDNAVMTVVGDVDIADASKKISDRFKRWKGVPVSITTPEVEPLSGVERKDISMQKEEALLLLGFPGVDVKDERKYALTVLGSMFSSGGGLLYKTIREDEGLAYSTGSSSVVLVDPGYYIFYVKTTEENLDKAYSLSLDVIDRVRKGEITEKEVGSAKNRALTAYASSLETNSDLGLIMALDELYGLGYNEYLKFTERIKAISRDELVRVANEILDPEKCAVVFVHSKSEG